MKTQKFIRNYLLLSFASLLMSGFCYSQDTPANQVPTPLKSVQMKEKTKGDIAKELIQRREISSKAAKETGDGQMKAESSSDMQNRSSDNIDLSIDQEHTRKTELGRINNIPNNNSKLKSSGLSVPEQNKQ